MALAARSPLAAALVLAVSGAPAGPATAASPHLAKIPPRGPCQVIVNESNAATTLGRLEDPSTRVFCVEPGDYRSFGRIDLRASGTDASRRYFVLRTEDGLVNAVHRPERAIFESMRVSGSWWVVQGLTFQPRDPSTYAMLTISGGHHNVVDGNLVDASEQANAGGQAGIVIGAWNNEEPATHNVIQRNVVRNGNQSRSPADYPGIVVFGGLVTGSNQDFNVIADNEVYDWGDGVALAGGPCGVPTPGQPRGTVIDGNDLYITAAKRIDCNSGAPDPDGACSCAETGLDLKSVTGSDPEFWTRVTNNRLWGFRPVPLARSCGGSGTFGQAIAAGNNCAGHVLVAGNVVLDSPVGVAISGSNWIVAGNLFHEIRAVQADRPLLPVAIFELETASDLEIQFNTIVGVDNAYDDASMNTRTTCNAVIDDLGVNQYLAARGSGQVTEHNFLYESTTANFVGTTNQVFPVVTDSENTEFCFWRKRLTAPERVCIPLGRTTADSPHVGATPSCDSELGAEFGLAPLGYDSVQAVPEPGASARAAIALLGLVALAAWRGTARRCTPVAG
jgi:hypothetical protein